MSGTRDAVRLLADLIERTSGNVIPEGHLPFLKDIAVARAQASGLRDVPTYVAALARGTIDGEWSRLLPLITVKESYLFRGPQQFRALRDTILPELIAARSASRRLRVWSAGCARGEEPATLAIVLNEIDALAGWDWRVEATDVDETALADARAGLYSARAVSQVPEALRERSFTRSGELYVFSRHLLARIDYRPINLVHEPFVSPVERCDVVMLRNVLIYFRPESQRRVVRGISACLAPDGALFLGPSETLWQLSEELVPQDLGDCFCYRPGPPGAPGRVRRRSDPAAQRRIPASRPAPVRPQTRHSPAAPTAPHAAREAGQPIAAPEAPPGAVAGIARAVAENRLQDAASSVEMALLDSQTDPVLRTLEGLVHDLSGSAGEAAAAYRAALFLDPALYQTRLLLADCLRRLGWETRARHEYREVLAQLAAGRGHDLAVEPLELPDREAAATRCRAALQRT